MLTSGDLSDDDIADRAGESDSAGETFGGCNQREWPTQRRWVMYLQLALLLWQNPLLAAIELSSGGSNNSYQGEASGLQVAS